MEISKTENLYGRANPLMDRQVVGVVCSEVVAMVAVVTSPTTGGCSAAVVVIVVLRRCSCGVV